MNQSENINELAAALAKAQGEMQAAIKDSVNPFFKSKYADLGSVWDAARPVLSKNGLCIMQTTEVCSERNQVVMVTTLAHISGQWMKSYLPLNPSKNDSQGMGAAITYLRRYSLSALVGVVCDDDDDGETAVGRGKTQPQQQQPKAPQNERIDDSQVAVISELSSRLDNASRKAFFEWLKKTCSVSDFNQIPKTAFDLCVGSLSNKLKYLKDQERERSVA
jgi:hypothetical protein